MRLFFIPFIQLAIKTKNTAFFCFFLFSISNIFSNNSFFIYTNKQQSVTEYKVNRISKGKKVESYAQLILQKEIVDIHSFEPSLSYVPGQNLKSLKYSWFENLESVIVDEAFVNISGNMLEGENMRALREISVEVNNGNTFFKEVVLGKSKPVFRFGSSLSSFNEKEIQKSELYSPVQLFILLRQMFASKDYFKEIHLIVNKDLHYDPYDIEYAKIEFTEQKMRIKGSVCRLVTVETSSEKAEFWLATQGAFRIVQAKLFDGSWYYFHKQFTRPINHWPF